MDISNVVYVATALVGGLWIVLWLFILWRRKASNLTSATGAKVQKDAAPDFLSVDREKRQAQIKAGEAYDKKLTEREVAEAAGRAAKPEPKELTMAERFARLASALFAVFSLATTIVGALNQAQGLEGAGQKFADIATQHPIAMAIAAFVIAFHIYQFISRKKWQDAPR